MRLRRLIVAICEMLTDRPLFPSSMQRYGSFDVSIEIDHFSCHFCFVLVFVFSHSPNHILGFSIEFVHTLDTFRFWKEMFLPWIFPWSRGNCQILIKVDKIVIHNKKTIRLDTPADRSEEIQKHLLQVIHFCGDARDHVSQPNQINHILSREFHLHHQMNILRIKNAPAESVNI